MAPAEPSLQYGTSATNNSSGDGDLEINVLMEDNENSSSDGEGCLACCMCKQAAGTLEEYEEDSQQLPGNGTHGTLVEEDNFSDKEINIIHETEVLAQASPRTMLMQVQAAIPAIWMMRMMAITFIIERKGCT